MAYAGFCSAIPTAMSLKPLFFMSLRGVNGYLAGR